VIPAGLAVDSAGTVFVADTGSDTVRKVTAAGVVTTIAGSPDASGAADGAGAAARFSSPSGVVVDGAGTIYVADLGNDTIRVVTPAGQVTTLAGAASQFGTADGQGAAARFANPGGIAIDGAGSLYTTDRPADTIRKVTPAGLVSTLAGAPSMVGTADGSGAAARFNFPTSAAVDANGNLYVADTNNHTIRKVTPLGLVSTFAGMAGISGTADGTGVGAQFTYPSGVVVDAAGNVYVADRGNRTIRVITPGAVVTTLAGSPQASGDDDGVGAAAGFSFPSAIAIDAGANLFVVDNTPIRKVTPAGKVTTIAGVPNVAGVLLGADIRFGQPQGLAVVGDSLVISDANAILLLRHGAQ
jgi:sugar lactone lactonase YvrE